MSGNAYLFVYGTLRPGAGCALGRLARERLRQETVDRGPATMRGRLIDLGRYPGLVANGGQGIVHGELLALKSPSLTWLWLDAYEGGGYRRVVGEAVSTTMARRVWAYCYVCKSAPGPAALIRSGDWLKQ